jgi:excisionase family DNA binding protein
VAEAAAYLRVSQNTVRNLAWRRAVGVPALRCGKRILFDRAQLDAWLTTRHQQHGGDAA